MLRYLTILCALLVLPLHAAKASDLPSWDIDTAHSHLSFTFTQQGAASTGKFGAFSGEIIFDPAQPDLSHARISVNMTSVDTQSAERDTSLQEADWFSSESFPESIYTVSKFNKIDENQYVAVGELELRGVKKVLDIPLTIRFSTDESGRDVATAEGALTLKRLDFGVGQGAWKDTQAVENEVKISIFVQAYKKAAP